MTFAFGQLPDVRRRLLREVAAVGIEGRTVTASDGLPLAVWTAGPLSRSTAPTVVLVHGATFSTLSTFDLAVPGLERASCSALLRLAGAGFGVVGLDLAGYGSSARRSRPGSLAADAADLTSVVEFVRTTTGGPVVVLGWSWGAQLAAVAGERGLADAVVFYASRWRPVPSSGGAAVLRDLPEWRRPTRIHALWDFTTPANYAEAVRDAFVSRVPEVDASVPTTALRCLGEGSQLFSPGAIRCPVLVVVGQDDPSRDDDDRAAMMQELRHHGSREVVLPAADHNAHLNESRDAFYATVASFVEGTTP